MVKKALQKSLYQDYDNIIVKCISSYENSLKQVAGVVAKNVDKHSKILDVGIGTGNLEKIIFQNLPTLRVEGVDVNKKFIAIAKQKFKNKNIAIRLKDIIEFKIKNEEYQAIVSCLSIHHFKNREKQMLFKRIFLGLKKGGVFINYDMTMPENEKKLSEMKAVLFDNMRKNGLTADFIMKEKKEMAERDKLAKLSQQKEWLEKFGFHFRILSLKGLFAVYICKK